MKTFSLLLLFIFTTKIAQVVTVDNGHDGALNREETSMFTGLANDESQTVFHLRPPQLQRQRQRQQQQQTVNYRANYTADFQHLVHPTCTGDALFVGITCYGERMEISSVSHPSISCSKLGKPIVSGGTSYACTNTCARNGTCSGVYEANDGVANAFDGVHGSVLFMCEGNSIQDVKAQYILNGRSNIGSCNADSTATVQENVRAARLGLSCPVSTGNTGDNANGDDRRYVYDDTYFECLRGLAGDTATPPNDIYTCFSGRNCEGRACNFTYDPIQILTHVPSFANDGCIQALVPIAGFPTPAPQVETSLYSARFEASWISISTNENCASNVDSSPTMRLTCASNGKSTIVFVNATDVTMTCINVEQNVLHCTGDPDQILNSFTTVVYDCYSTNIPLSTVTYPESTGICDANPVDAYLASRVTLGIACNDDMILRDDRLFECSSSHHDFLQYDLGLLPYNLDGWRYMCSEGSLFDSNSLASDVRIIPSVSITTDEYWQSNASASCYQQNNIDVMAPPVTIVVSAPTLSPIQASTKPEAAPTEVPEVTTPVPLPTQSARPETISSFPITIMPINSFQPSLMNSINNTLSNEKSGNNKVFITSAVGGVIGGIILSVFLFILYIKGKHDGVVEHKDEPVRPVKDRNDTENNTESQNDPGTQQSSSHRGNGEQPTIIATPMETTTSSFYELHYKDQSRSVIGTGGGRTSSNDRKTSPFAARYYNSDIADSANNMKPTSGIEIPTVDAIMCPGISLLGESDSSIRQLGDSNSSLQAVGESNRSFRFLNESNSTIPTESNVDNVNKPSSTISHLVDSNSSLRMIGESNRSFHILDVSNSTIPTESNTSSNSYKRKEAAFSSSAVEL